MPEVEIVSQDLNGLGWTIKALMDDNLSKPGVHEKLRRISGSLVVRETGADVAVTVYFDQGGYRIQDGAIDRPSARLEADFERLSELTSGQVHPIKALLTGKIKARGNLIKLLKMAQAVISKE